MTTRNSFEANPAASRQRDFYFAVYACCMRTLVVDNASPRIERLTQLIGGSVEVALWSALPRDTSAYDLVVLSGGKMKEVEASGPELTPEMSLILGATQPLIGICYGCELITKAFGGTLMRMPHIEQGITQVDTHYHDPLFAGKKSLQLYENHRWRIRNLPPTLIPLAVSDHGIEIIRHATRPIYGLQFHPENFVDQQEGDELFARLIDIVLV